MSGAVELRLLKRFHSFMLGSWSSMVPLFGRFSRGLLFPMIVFFGLDVTIRINVDLPVHADSI